MPRKTREQSFHDLEDWELDRILTPDKKLTEFDDVLEAQQEQGFLMSSELRFDEITEWRYYAEFFNDHEDEFFWSVFDKVDACYPVHKEDFRPPLAIGVPVRSLPKEAFLPHEDCSRTTMKALFLYGWKMAIKVGYRPEEITEPILQLMQNTIKLKRKK